MPARGGRSRRWYSHRRCSPRKCGAAPGRRYAPERYGSPARYWARCQSQSWSRSIRHGPAPGARPHSPRLTTLTVPGWRLVRVLIGSHPSPGRAGTGSRCPILPGTPKRPPGSRPNPTCHQPPGAASQSASPLCPSLTTLQHIPAARGVQAPFCPNDGALLPLSDVQTNLPIVGGQPGCVLGQRLPYLTAVLSNQALGVENKRNVQWDGALPSSGASV